MSKVDGIVLYNEIDKLHPVDLSYELWDIDAKRLDEHRHARETVGASNLDAYNVDDSLAGFLANALIIRNQYDTLELSNWREIAEECHCNVTGDLVEDMAFAIKTLTAYKVNNDAMGTIEGLQEVKRALRIAFTLVPYLSIPGVNSWYEINSEDYYSLEDFTVEEANKLRANRARHNALTRMRYGIAEPDLHDLTNYLSDIFAIMLNRLAKVGHGAPYNVGFDEWRIILQNMATMTETLTHKGKKKVPFMNLVEEHFVSLWD